MFPSRRRDAPVERRPLALLSENKLVVGITFATALVLGAFFTLVTGSWIFLPVVLIVHALATVVVVGTVFRMTDEVEKPDPVTVAKLEAEGVDAPEERLNESVGRATDRSA